MSQKKGTGWFVFFALVFFAAAGFFGFLGADKILNYVNSSYPALNKNAYVGGDAYNFIINAEYATGFFVLAVGNLVCGVICCAVRPVLRALYDRA